MSTKVKVGIAAVIVTALVALIVLDQGTTPKDGAAAPPSTPSDALPVRPPEAKRLTAEEEEHFFKAFDKDAKKDKAPAPAAGKTPAVKGREEENIKDLKRESVTTPVTPAPASAPAAEEYVIKQGDTLESIALAQYKDRRGVAWIVKANPNVNPALLRVGKKLSLPPKPEKPEEAVKIEGAVAIDASGGQKFWTVQPGDTLGSISQKVYNTARYADKILEANQEKLSDAHMLFVGMKLVLPADLARKESSNKEPMQGTGTVATTAEPAPAGAARTTHQVQPTESLWKIAAKYAKDRGVEEMIRLIVDANKDKLKDEKSLLRAGWQLVIPE